MPPIASRSRDLAAPGQAMVFTLLADYFVGQIDLKAFCRLYPEHPVLKTNPLVLEPRAGAFVYIARFGGVVFWNCPPDLIILVHDQLRALPGLNQLEERARDGLSVSVGAAEDAVGFSAVQLRLFTLDHLCLVSLALAQSVALDHFEAAVSQAMGRFQPIVEKLSTEGKLDITHREALRIVGFALTVKAAVLDSLTLFDDPPEIWESETLAHLDSELFGQFDLAERLSAIREKLGYFHEAGATLLGLLDTRLNRKLEWVIILLIGSELLLFLAK